MSYKKLNWKLCLQNVGHYFLSLNVLGIFLTHLGRDKIVAIAQRTFGNAISWMQMN